MPQKPAKARLLVVDDDDDNRRMIARRLEHEGFEVLEAASGGEALRLVEEQHINLMVLDVMMPDMSGLEVLETVRGTAPRADLPVLMATAKTGSDDMVDALRRGANDYVTKPIDFPVLVARINSHLQTRAQASTVPAAATAIPADGRVAPGTMLDGRYEVRRMLGEGAFAIVYEATQLSTGQTVAMKILHTHRALDDDALERERFEREMQTIAHLHHPHIVRLIDYGVLKATLRHVDSGWIETAEGAGFAVDQTSGGGRVLVRRLPYIVMEFVHGRTLQQLIKDEGAFDLGEAVDLMLPVLSAVAEGHRAGVVHRDLKPPNIMVPTSSIGRFDPRVLDFGIAKPQDEDTFMRRDESFFGTPEYMAPEVLSGDGSAGPIADQYALAIILYEMLKGSTARESESYVNLLSTIANEDLKRLKGLPDAFWSVLARATSRFPERRFTSVDAFGKALLPFASEDGQSQWATGFSVPTDPPPPPMDTAAATEEQSARQAWWVAAAFALVGAGLFIAAWLLG